MDLLQNDGLIGVNDTVVLFYHICIDPTVCYVTMQRVIIRLNLTKMLEM